ncbi:tryptophan synthase subunit alpha [Acetobacter pasteurianus]|uniref:Tryptophan synthase alpha chain n=2 Tax=Acetobacter pasteurianus TaxID=438 RepID=A0A401WQD4_ACEPA|nr:tryptophan synthase subunit alpha [Acetobacter pasteurianus]OAZ72279.1 Tryptophan synthase [Acetobacter pasteurianus]QHM91229.1 tryptophan synthase subunit alpha [Acetobacter pasteurianus]RCL07462.1 tryptophan synthase subunit alpha [Acetobacter pasteurianus]GAB30930.1 tryptophan synthase alpha subunit [Acetobacter pasteurianus subsp. pasteurianus LMG 1262 = NBRC 106471]GCD48735.1 tryptophan synthase subunit alpha [Acetobacter pasteurianus subsp. pasteurianus LMG 1262 = NBRC 106471]
MSRIAARFKALAAQGRGALIPYLEAYDPDWDTSLELLRKMPAAGADLIEIGMPFSDPSADGPVIQAAARRGLKAGATLAGVLDMVTDFRQQDNETPIILMGYLNPVESYGYERFCRDAASAGVDGLILVDLPPEEADVLAPFAKANKLDIIRLVAPTTSDERLPYVLSHASGFVYYVSITGITGTRSATTHDLEAAIPRLRKVTKLPIAIGFGVRTPQQAANASSIADGAVVASALLSTLAETLDDKGRATAETLPRVLAQIEDLAKAVRSADGKAV